MNESTTDVDETKDFVHIRALLGPTWVWCETPRRSYYKPSPGLLGRSSIAALQLDANIHNVQVTGIGSSCCDGCDCAVVG